MGMKHILQEILDKLNDERDLFMSEVILLQSRQGKAAIKRHFPDSPELCQAAGIRETTYERWSRGAKIDRWIQSINLPQV